MTSIVHLSDFHFGTINKQSAQALVEFLNSNNHNLVVISGDLTQRAKIKEFKAAQKFISSISGDKIIVPGNHDIPLYRFWERIMRPFDNYKNHIGGPDYQEYATNNFFILGLNSSRASRAKSGQISKKQIQWAQEKFSKLSPETFRIITTHHPLSEMEKEALLSSTNQRRKTDIVMHGHTHHTLINLWQSQTKQQLIEIIAGTAISTRTRQQNNSFNILVLNYPVVDIEIYEYQDQSNHFEKVNTNSFKIS